MLLLLVIYEEKHKADYLVHTADLGRYFIAAAADFGALDSSPFARGLFVVDGAA